jgi:hypothetical protein
MDYVKYFINIFDDKTWLEWNNLTRKYIEVPKTCTPEIDIVFLYVKGNRNKKGDGKFFHGYVKVGDDVEETKEMRESEQLAESITRKYVTFYTSTTPMYLKDFMEKFAPPPVVPQALYKTLQSENGASQIHTLRQPFSAYKEFLYVT